jgi:hypothetical protein
MALAATLLVALLAGCGGSSGSSGVSAQSYVKSVCSAVGPFEKDLLRRSNALNVSTLTNPAQGKQALQGFMSAVVADTDHAVSQLKTAGSPNVHNGATISAAIVSAFNQLRGALVQVQAQTNALPTNSAAAFKTAADSLGSAVRTSLGSIGAGLNGLKSTELEKAAKSAPACQSIGS